MFWRFGFHTTTSLSALLDRPPSSLFLESILDEDDLLQEVKSQNTKLIEYLSRHEVMARLLGYVSGTVGWDGVEDEAEGEVSDEIKIEREKSRYK